MTRIIVIRHGYSVSNAAGRFTGQIDAPLHEIGKEQAKLIADYLAAHEKIDAVYASDLSRAMDTARPTAERFGLTVTPVPALRELHEGVWQGMLFEDVTRDCKEEFEKHVNDPYYPCPGGESLADVYARISDAVIRLATENEGKCIMLVSHGGAIRTVRCMAGEGDVKNLYRYPNVKNGTILIYRYENGKLTTETDEITAHLDAGSNASARPEIH